MHKLFGDKVQEHNIMRYPAIFLVGGVACLFCGFLCGIILYYGLGVAALIGLAVGGGFLFYEVRVHRALLTSLAPLAC